VSLGDWNRVAGYPDWYFGLGIRRADGRLEVEVAGPKGQSFCVEASGWAEARERAADEIAALARRPVDPGATLKTGEGSG
jgi:hypothetical protein